MSSGAYKPENHGKPLITLKTDWRGLKFSDFGEKPYVQHDLPSLEGSGRKHNQINARTNDLERFTKLLTSKPGLKFQGNQALLQNAGTITDIANGAKKGFKGFDLNKLKDKAIDTIKNNAMATTAIFAQVPLNGTGTHFINNGGSTYLKSGGEAPKGSAFGDFLRNSLGSGVGTIDGASSALSGDDIGSPYGGGGLNADTGSNNLGVPQNPKKDEFTYLGKMITKDGGSYPTAPPKAPVSTDKFKLNPEKSEHYQTGDKTAASKFSITQKNGAAIEENYGVKKDFFQEKDSEQLSAPSYDIDDQSGNKKNYLTSPVYIQSRLKLGDQGNKNTEGVDELNKLEESTRSLLGDQAVDIIPFEFNIVEAGGASKYLYFRAHLDSLDDNYSGDWSGTKYIGRAEEFYTYQGFKRDISFAFKMAAFSKDELIPLYKKLNALVGSTAPTYGQAGQFMRGTLSRITIGDYISKQSGFISSVGLSWDQNYPWEIDLYNEGYLRVPHLLNVSISFTPIHNFNVSSQVQNYIGGNSDFTVRPKRQKAASAIESQGAQPLATTGPVVEKPVIPVPPPAIPKPEVSSASPQNIKEMGGHGLVVSLMGMTYYQDYTDGINTVSIAARGSKDGYAESLKTRAKGQAKQKLFNLRTAND